MLVFNPNNRLTASECLKLKVFDKIRKSQLEQPAKHKIKIEIDETQFFKYE